MNQPTQSNLLIHEKSPYLLQHAHNPVSWYPWGPLVFEQARSQDKPLLLSIGYATCHWCHVMERESFENQAIARILNEKFFSIKVDREERPDIDQVYMRALHAMGQQGGWPLNIFLTPDGLPIAGGTYFPPKPLYGRPSFPQIIEAISTAWQNERSRLLESSQAIYTFLQKSEQSQMARELPSWLDIDQCVSQLKETYDPYRGGFLTNGPNKFPPSLQFLLLLSSYRKNKEAGLLEIVEHTLERMKRGGIYDQIGGGLARYSTDHDWLVPHFEKMLYDNAFFAWAMVEAYRLTKKEEYRQWALDLFTYIERDMTSPEGAFYCAEDADSEGKEGKFYVWSFQEIQNVLENAGFSLQECKELCWFWGVTARGNFEGMNILHEPLSREQYLKTTDYSREEWALLLDKARQALFRVRTKRIRPLRDDKILTAWNAYMISALSQAARTFALPQLARRAQRAADFLWNELRTPRGELLRRFRDGDARFAGGLSDYAALGCAFVDLYRANFNPENMQRASELSRLIIEKFTRPQGGFYDTPQESSDLIVRPVDFYDGVEPCGNALAARLYYSLSRYGIEVSQNQAALKSILSDLAGSIKANGSIHTFLLYTCCHFLEEPLEIAIIEPAKSSPLPKETTEILDWLNHDLSGESIIALTSQDELVDGSLERIIPLLAGRHTSKQKTSIYVCRDLSCQKPVHSLSELRSLLRF